MIQNNGKNRSDNADDHHYHCDHNDDHRHFDHNDDHRHCDHNNDHRHCDHNDDHRRCDHNDSRDPADYHHQIILMIMSVMNHDSGDSDNGEEG